jgi:archaellum component FlaC
MPLPLEILIRNNEERTKEIIQLNVRLGKIEEDIAELKSVLADAIKIVKDLKDKVDYANS